MPWYRFPTNWQERARRAAATVKPRNKFDEALLELVKCAAEDRAPTLAGTPIHLNLGSRANLNAPPPCRVCGWISDRLCDRILPMPFVSHGKRLTCDAPICEFCSWSPEPGKDLCPACVILYRRWLVETQLIPLT